MTDREVRVELSSRAEQQVIDLPEKLRWRVRVSLLELLDDPLPLARGAMLFRAGGEEIPDAYEWDVGGVKLFYNILDRPPFLRVIVQIVLIDAL